MRAKLSKRTIDGLAIEPRAYICWDEALRGFGCRVLPSGVKSYIARYRTKDGVERQLSLGQHGPLAPDAARRLAQQHLAAAAFGRDPLAERQAARAQREILASGPTTVSEFAEAWVTHQRSRRRPLRERTLREYERQLAREIEPRLGKRDFAALVKADVQALFEDLSSRPVLANRCIDLLSAIWRWAEDGGRVSGVNPCRGIERFPERRRERYFTHAELSRIGAAMRKLDRRRGPGRSVVGPRVALLVRLLAFTGCRPGEIKGLPWKDVDLVRRVIHLRDAKTGDRDVWLSSPALETLEQLRALPVRLKKETVDSPLVFPSPRNPQIPVKEFRKPWRALLIAAGVEHCAPYVFRHTFASESEALGHSPYLTAALLGHSAGRRDQTRGYIHHIPEDVRRSSERIAGRLAAALESETTGGAIVVPLRA